MIIKRKHTSHYAIVPNSTADDRNIKADALGVLVYLLAKPNDWQVNIANLRERFGLGRNRVYSILEELTGAGYVQRSQARNPESRFLGVEYIVFDSPESCGVAEVSAANTQETPLPGFGEAVKSPDRQPRGTTASRISASRKTGHILKNQSTNSPSEELKAPQRGFEEKGSGQAPPTLNAQVWNAAKAILQPKEHGCVVRWLRRVNGRPNGLETLLQIIQSAAKAGTPQAVSYVTKVLNDKFPAPPDPRTQPRSWWEAAAQAVPKTKHWPEDWGPRPGEAGCLMPEDLITPELTRAVSMRRVA